jgi:hypothetical protein
MSFIEDKLLSNPLTEEEYQKARTKVVSDAYFRMTYKSKPCSAESLDWLIKFHAVWDRYDPMKAFDNLNRR